MARFDLLHFSIWQEHSAQRMGTDALLLGSWAWQTKLPESPRLLDVGTGTGIVALLLAQRYPQAELWAWEVDAGALRDAYHNVAHSPYASRVHVVARDYRQGRASGEAPFDLIISNPPYYSEDTLPLDQRLAHARHTSAGLSPELLLTSAHELLTPQGALVMITPQDSLPRLRQLAVAQGWYLAEEVTIYSLPDRPKRSLHLWRRLSSLTSYTPTLRTSLLLQEHPDHPSPAYRAWTKDYLRPSNEEQA